MNATTPDTIHFHNSAEEAARYKALVVECREALADGANGYWGWRHDAETLLAKIDRTLEVS